MTTENMRTETLKPAESLKKVVMQQLGFTTEEQYQDWFEEERDKIIDNQIDDMLFRGIHI